MDVTVYNVRKVQSNRTHKATIDIFIDTVRAFLSDETAMELVKKILAALATDYVSLPQKPRADKLSKLYQQLGLIQKEEML